MKGQRIFGLDLIRVFAIGMIAFAQFVWMMPAASRLSIQAGSVIRFIGLETFLVLSGFFMYVKLYPIYLHKNFGWRQTREYVVNRLRQILPLYFLALILNLCIAASLSYSIQDGWKYFLLVQNLTNACLLSFGNPGAFPLYCLEVFYFRWYYL